MNLKVVWQIIFNSGKQAFSGFLWKFWFGGASVLIALIKLSKDDTFGIFKLPILIAFYFSSGIFLLRFILLIIRQIFIYLHELNNESDYGKAIISLKEMFSV